MRKSIFTIGMFVICSSVFFFCAVSSEATPDQLVTNALDDLKSMSDEVITRRQDVTDAWSLVDKISSKWSSVSDANRRKSTINYVVDLMGSNFWAIAASLAGQTEAAFKLVYETSSLMDLYSSTLNNVKSKIDWFYEVTVPLYNSAHKNAVNTVNSHHASQHTSPSDVNHFVPSWEKKTCRDDLLSFSCRGNHFVSGTCSVTFPTPSAAYSTHQLRCGQETPPAGYSSPIAGDGIIYYTCDEVGYAKHHVRFCQKWFWEGDVRKERCNQGYRNCQNTKRDHRNTWWSFSGSHDDSLESGSTGSGLHDPYDPNGIHSSTQTTRPCGDSTSASGDHSL